ncbi:MAG: hypothetical protein EB006_11150, partial [Betaproteobacteria bacterium]|nr:hypothetical protein [Betaproteobacteria bacterium]
FSPHQDLISERLKALWRMQRGDIDLIIAPVSTAAMAIAPRAMISGRSFVFRRGDCLGSNKLATQLTEWLEPGYFLTQSFGITWLRRQDERWPPGTRACGLHKPERIR